MKTMASKLILVIVNEGKTARFLTIGLQQAGYRVSLERDGVRGLACAHRESPDMVLLDWMLPGMDSTEVCRKIREFFPVPILLVTAASATENNIAVPDSGLNDSIRKPFDIGGLLEKIDALFRKNEFQEAARQTLTLKDLSLNITRHTVQRGCTNIALTKREFDLLEYLLRNQGLVLTRVQILKHVWEDENRKNITIVDVYIRYLRSKIDDPFRTSLIHTVRGVGYVLKDSEGPA